ncbi:MAG: precorrin-6A reductase [Nitrospirae bacterium]|nr:precorrin-6A reductase [Nitrospirota bacterium]
MPSSVINPIINPSNTGKTTLILGGTSETFDTVDQLISENKDYLISVATQYGFDLFSEIYESRVIQKRFNQDTLSAFIREENISTIIDCTHPYAKEITEIALSTCKVMDIQYISKIRIVERDDLNYEKVRYADNFDQIVNIVKSLEIKRILFTTGSNNLSWLKQLDKYEIYIRVLPYEDSIKKCIEAGIKRQNIIAMQGPFSSELNSAIINQYNIDCLVTKQSGKTGGYGEKVTSVMLNDIWLIIIKN